MRFWDSSALGPLFLKQPMSRGMQALLREDTEVVIWWGASVECGSALARSVREGWISRSTGRAAQQGMGELQASAYEVQPTDEVRTRAVRLLNLHPLRAADALQLSAGLIWCGERTAGAEFVCLDSRLREAAGREGFDVLPLLLES